MATITWALDASGSWGTAANWSGGVVPGAGDDVVINTASYQTIDTLVGLGITYNNYAANSISVGLDAFVIVNATVTVASFSSFGDLSIGNGALDLGAADGFAASLTAYYPGGFTAGGGSISGTGTFSVLGNVNVETNASLAMTGAGLSVFDASTSDTGGVILDGFRTLENAGTFDDLGGGVQIGFSGEILTGTFTNDANATYNFQAASQIKGYGLASFNNSGLVEQTAASGTSDISANFTDSGAGSVSVQGGTLQFSGSGSSAADTMTVAGGATLIFGGAAGSIFTLTGAVLNGAGTVGVAAGTLELGADTMLFGNFQQGSGTLDGTGALTISGGATFFADGSGVALAQTGAGSTLLLGATNLGADLWLDGGRLLENAGPFTVVAAATFHLGANPNGASAGGGTIQNDLGTTFDLAAPTQFVAGLGATAFVDGGLLEQTAPGTSNIGVDFTETAAGSVSIAAGGALELSGAANSLAASVSGAGALVLDGGATSLASGATISTARWWTQGSTTSVALLGNLVYRGGFLLGIGATLKLAGGYLDLTRSATLRGTVVGSHALFTFGATSVSAFFVGGAVQWQNHGIVTQKSFRVTIGDPLGGVAGLNNVAAATYDIVDNTGVARGSSASSWIINAGLFEKTGGAGTSVIVPRIINNGTIEDSSGALDLRGSLSGTGLAQIIGGGKLSLEAAVASTQTVDFTGAATGELLLNDLSVNGVQLFHGKVAGFAIGDTIDAGAPFGAGTTFTFTENVGGLSGVLAIANGTKHAAIDLAGAYAQSSFHMQADGHGGTLFTYF